MSANFELFAVRTVEHLIDDRLLTGFVDDR
jgi:hypothetical protein